jgi:Rrf2 family protein
MHLFAQEEYGLRCMLQVARNGGQEPLSIPQIADAEGLSTEYAAKLLRTLRQGGLLTSSRGAGGGYRLARPASEITAWDVIEVLGGSFFPESFCEAHPGQLRDCVRSSNCSVRALWHKVEGAVRGILSRVTLADMQHKEAQVMQLLSATEGNLASAPEP